MSSTKAEAAGVISVNGVSDASPIPRFNAGSSVKIYTFGIIFRHTNFWYNSYIALNFSTNFSAISTKAFADKERLSKDCAANAIFLFISGFIGTEHIPL